MTDRYHPRLPKKIRRAGLHVPWHADEKRDVLDHRFNGNLSDPWRIELRYKLYKLCPLKCVGEDPGGQIEARVQTIWKERPRQRRGLTFQRSPVSDQQHRAPSAALWSYGGVERVEGFPVPFHQFSEHTTCHQGICRENPETYNVDALGGLTH